MTRKILIIEDEDRLRRILKMVIIEDGFMVEAESNGQAGIEKWKTFRPDIVLTDIKMKPIDGFGVLEFGQANFPDTPVIVLTAFGSIQTAVSAMKKGAFDFLTKPVNHDQLLDLIGQAIHTIPASHENKYELVGNSRVIQKINSDIIAFSPTDSSVLITGESGTGKELVARNIHKHSNRSQGPFVRVNCAAIPKDLLESEFFGHKKGAFTGAIETRQGAFEKANHGVLFLDEIGDLPLDLQPKLLHAVEEKIITPVGSKKSIPLSIKILSATNMDLKKMVQDHRFRSDLYYRLNIVNIQVPPLKNRMDDIEPLTRHFLKQIGTAFNKKGYQLSKESKTLLGRHSWPGNIRELKNVIERAMLLCNQPVITPDYISLELDLPLSPPDSKTTSSPMDLMAQEQSLLLAALEKNYWNQSKAARELGITRSALRYRLQKYGLKTNLNE